VRNGQRRCIGVSAGPLAAAALAAAIAGCGNSRTPVPDLSRPAAPAAFVRLDWRKANVSLRVPGNWTVRGEQAPLVAVVSSGPAIIAVWSHPRGAPAPVGAAALGRARRDLVAAAKRSDPRLRLIRASVTTVRALPAIELDAFEQIGGQTRRVRSTHAFTATSELVLDEYAPPAVFHTVDHAVFSPVKRSLRLLTSSSA
jgi:hypothetical protein